MTNASHSSIRFGPRTIPLKWPSSVAVTSVSRQAMQRVDEDAILLNAINAPLAPLGVTLDTLLADATSPLVVVNDATRSTPTARVMRHILPALNRNGRWEIIVATGLHRAPNDSELARIFGDTLPQVRDRILIHDGRDNASLGTRETPFGPVTLNRAVLRSDLVILVNSIEPHFFAGFTGGRKSILPGVAGRETVERSHAGAVSPAAGPLRLEGNPVREFIEVGSQAIPAERIWGIQMVLDADDRIAAAYTGDIDACFRHACDAALKYNLVTIDEDFDIVVAAVHPPLDLNLYQMQKGWELCQGAVRKGGVMIVTSACTEGVGSPFYQRLSEEFPNPGDWLGLAERPYTMGLHKLVRTARMRARCRLMAVTTMSPYDVQRFGYDPHSNVNAAITAACDHVGTPARALIVHDAALTTVMKRSKDITG